MSYSKKLSLFILLDLIIVWFSIYSSYYFRFDESIPSFYVHQCVTFCIVSTVVFTASMFYFKLYNRIWQYASVGEMISIAKAAAWSCVISYLLTCFLTYRVVPLHVFLRTFETTLLLLGGLRFGWRIYTDSYRKKIPTQSKALIIGAGGCGSSVAKRLKANKDSKVYPVAFIDDNTLKHRQEVCGLPVLGNRDSIVEIVEKQGIDEIIIAMPSASKREISKIIEICKTTSASLKIIPRIDDLLTGKLSYNEIRNVEVEDLLGRDPVNLDLGGIAGYVKNKTVLITGAGGSIGSELCRQIARFEPAVLLLLGHGENSIYSIEMELSRRFPTLRMESIIADVQDENRIDEVFGMYRPEVVFHAAAHKHVPLMERNPSEAIKNNVFGTKHVADSADKYGTERFVLISSDKAVNPTSVMGATKRIAEMYIQSLNNSSLTKFVAVRFGNVLGSRGSVIPRFKEQIAMGGPVTVTDPKMIRYFMTIPEASQLVIQAGMFAEGGEIFILDMGKPVNIVDLAKDLIRLSGFESNVDIDIVFTGIRPGEKLYEELLMDEEGLINTNHKRIFIGKPVNLSRASLELAIKQLEKLINEDQMVIRDSLKHLVPTFKNEYVS
ncbi:nucleoside-diphosphate sugar epimerase/dehydratase [Paenibacillus sp. FSL H7-0331]|uniref:polysaccharide biosynthesis protein n=1 Tax=Paenibacillus sp. FSL H7-0331 TaxID=1920421 RepID=UPI00096C3FF3|nr:nucleoside-diphosphate sugar epimerase/dehydratase [Paenibacillus sp. FSL H7-0331]OMF13557.1 polysaccharide biosynthesis protein [Paenibacillus sp. FSL H7-0331]